MALNSAHIIDHHSEGQKSRQTSMSSLLKVFQNQIRALALMSHLEDLENNMFSRSFRLLAETCLLVRLRSLLS